MLRGVLRRGRLLQRALFALTLAETDPPSLGTADALSEVTRHAERVVVGSTSLLLLPDERRGAFPQGLVGEGGFMRWLYKQCFQRAYHARLRCSQLFEALCERLPPHLPPPPPSHSPPPPSRPSGLWVRMEYPTEDQIPLLARLDGREEGEDWSNLTQYPAGEGEVEEEELRWLERVGACVDSAFWTLREGQVATNTPPILHTYSDLSPLTPPPGSATGDHFARFFLTP